MHFYIFFNINIISGTTRYDTDEHFHNTSHFVMILARDINVGRICHFGEYVFGFLNPIRRRVTIYRNISHKRSSRAENLTRILMIILNIQRVVSNGNC